MQENTGLLGENETSKSTEFAQYCPSLSYKQVFF